MVKVLSIPGHSVHVTDMMDGDIAIITEWGNDPTIGYVGRVVQRHGDDLIEVGHNVARTWTDAFHAAHHLDINRRYMVEILPPGTVLEIQ